MGIITTGQVARPRHLLNDPSVPLSHGETVSWSSMAALQQTRPFGT